MNTTHQIEHQAVSALIPYARNSRTHSDEQVAQIAGSIREFGFTNPVLIDKDGTIIAGHGRVMAARKLGMETVPCIRLGHLTQAQVRAYVIADNKLALNAGWDDAMLKAELDALREDGFDVELTGFSEEELAGLMQTPTGDIDANPDEAPSPPETARTKRGDLWIMGAHRLLCGDSTQQDDVARLLNGKKADLVFSDPPYGVSFQSGMSKRFDVILNDDKTLEIAQVVWDAMADDTAAFIWTSHHVYPVWRAQFERFYKQTIVWHKGGGGMGDLQGQYALDYEMALFCAKGSPKFRCGRGAATWQVQKDAASLYVHPTQKPVELAERAIQDFSDEGSMVLDLFGGSGSTLIACQRKRRQGLLMELDPTFCDVIVQRWQNITRLDAVNEATGLTFNATNAAAVKGQPPEPPPRGEP